MAIAQWIGAAIVLLGVAIICAGYRRRMKADFE
jgi:hypothetical protein